MIIMIKKMMEQVCLNTDLKSVECFTYLVNIKPVYNVWTLAMCSPAAHIRETKF